MHPVIQILSFLQVLNDTVKENFKSVLELQVSQNFLKLDTINYKIV